MNFRNWVTGVGGILCLLARSNHTCSKIYYFLSDIIYVMVLWKYLNIWATNKSMFNSEKTFYYSEVAFLNAQVLETEYFVNEEKIKDLDSYFYHFF